MGGLYVHLAHRSKHRPQRRVAGVMLSRSAAPLGLLHVDWFNHDVDGQLRLVGEAAAARTGRRVHVEKRRVHAMNPTPWREPDAPRDPNPTLPDARRRRGRRKERTDKKAAGPKAAIFSKSAAARRGMRCALLTCEVPVELVTPNRTSWSRTLQVGCGRLPPPG